MTRTRRILQAAVAVALTGACTTGATPPPEATEEQRLPALPDVGPVLLPAGFATYETHQYEFSSTHPVHVDTGFFGFDVSNDTGTNERCRAQITVSPYDPALATAQAYVDELSTKLCDADWSSTDDRTWRQDPGDPTLWTIETTAVDTGWFRTSRTPAVGVFVIDPDREVVVGLWAEVDVYRPEQAVRVARQVAASAG